MRRWQKFAAASLENQVARGRKARSKNMFRRYKFSVCVPGTKLCAPYIRLLRLCQLEKVREENFRLKCPALDA